MHYKGDLSTLADAWPTKLNGAAERTQTELSHPDILPSTFTTALTVTMTKIFVTGATGLVATALIPKLVAARHTVVGLARSPESLEKLEAAGIQGVQGNITDLDICAAAVRDADTVVHLAFDHKLAYHSGKLAEACEQDQAVIRAMIDVLLASPSSTTKTFIVASGTLGLPPNGDETSGAERNGPAAVRHQSTDLVFSYVDKGLRAIQIRLAPITYGSAKPHDIIGWQIAKAKENGYAAYIDSDNAWAACDVRDAADLYVRAIEADNLPNPCTLHGLAEEGVPVKDVAEVIARKTGVEAKAVSRDKIIEVLGFAGMVMIIAHKAKADRTKKITGWQPKEAELLAQMESYRLSSDCSNRELQYTAHLFLVADLHTPYAPLGVGSWNDGSDQRASGLRKRYMGPSSSACN